MRVPRSQLPRPAAGSGNGGIEVLGLLVYLFLFYVLHASWQAAITWGFVVLALTGNRTETRIVERVAVRSSSDGEP